MRSPLFFSPGTVVVVIFFVVFCWSKNCLLLPLPPATPSKTCVSAGWAAKLSSKYCPQRLLLLRESLPGLLLTVMVGIFVVVVVVGDVSCFCWCSKVKICCCCSLFVFILTLVKFPAYYPNSCPCSFYPILLLSLVVVVGVLLLLEFVVVGTNRRCSFGYVCFQQQRVDD